MTLRSVVLSCARFLKPEDLVPAPQASAGMTKQAATDRNTGMDTPTSDGMPLREIAVPGAATRPQAIPAQALEAASQSPNMPSAPSLQSWAALESKTASLDAESGAAALAAGLRAGPPLSQQAKDSDDSGNGQRGRPHSTDAQASGEENAPAFWEARRGSSFNSDHVHGSSAALSALAQAYSRQGSPGPVGSAQDAQMAAIERSPLETSRLLRDMATKIDSHDNLAELALPLEGQPQEPAPGPGPAPGSSPRGQGSKAEKIRTYRGPQHRTVLLDWPSPRHSAPVNPFAQAAEQAGDFGDPALESSSRSASPWSPAAAAAGSEAKSPKSVANLSTRCEAGSCQLPPGAARQEERPADPDGGMAFSSDNSKAARKDSASTTASARCILMPSVQAESASERPAIISLCMQRSHACSVGSCISIGGMWVSTGPWLQWHSSSSMHAPGIARARVSGLPMTVQGWRQGHGRRLIQRGADAAGQEPAPRSLGRPGRARAQPHQPALPAWHARRSCEPWAASASTCL